MSTLICSFDGLHDNRVLRYCADFEAHTLHMDTQSETGEKVSVRFTGLLAHWFENVIQDNILFGMDEITVDRFFQQYKDLLGGTISYGFPACCSIEELRKRMEREHIRVFVIDSSLGLCGFSDKGWGRFGKEQICRLKIRRMKEELAKDLVVRPWCISEIVNTHEDCPELQAVLEEYHKPVVIQDQVLGELTLDKDYDTFEGEIQWCGKDVLLSLEVNAESKPSWTRARSAAKKLLADCETWDKAMRELAAKNLTELANNWLSQDEENPRNPETDPITEDELARRISLTSLSVTSGGSFTAWFDCDEMFTDHAVTVYGSLKKGLKTANIEG